MEKFKNIFNKMNAFLLAVLLTFLMLFLNSEMAQNFLNPIAVRFTDIPNFRLILTSVLFLILTTLLISLFRKTNKENFFFEVTKGLPRCSRGYIGRPNTFQYTSNLNCGLSQEEPKNCEKVAEEANTNPHFGWDGIVNVRGTADCNQNTPAKGDATGTNVFGGCGCDQSGMTVYPFIPIGNGSVSQCSQSY